MRRAGSSALAAAGVGAVSVLGGGGTPAWERHGRWWGEKDGRRRRDLIVEHHERPGHPLIT